MKKIYLNVKILFLLNLEFSFDNITSFVDIYLKKYWYILNFEPNWLKTQLLQIFFIVLFTRLDDLSENLAIFAEELLLPILQLHYHFFFKFYSLYCAIYCS